MRKQRLVNSYAISALAVNAENLLRPRERLVTGQANLTCLFAILDFCLCFCFRPSNRPSVSLSLSIDVCKCS